MNKSMLMISVCVCVAALFWACRQDTVTGRLYAETTSEEEDAVSRFSKDDGPPGHPPRNVRFTTLDLLPYTNHHIAATSWTVGVPVWFDKNDRDLRRLRLGEQRLAGVTYYIVDFFTAPANEAIVFGDGVEGLSDSLPPLLERESIDLDRTADIVYLLHAAHVTRPLSDEEREDLEEADDYPAVVRLTFRYADGESREIPLRLHQDVDHWFHETAPAPLPRAALAWQNRYRDSENDHAVLYSRGVPNPRPDVEIRALAIELPEEKERRAAYALLALTLGRLVD